MTQGKLFDIGPNEDSWKVVNFSADGSNPQEERLRLENKYWRITEITDKFNRQSVSYQLSKKDRLHRWLKYKEGFSSELVRILFKDFGLKVGDPVMIKSEKSHCICSSQDGESTYIYSVAPTVSKIYFD